MEQFSHVKLYLIFFLFFCLNNKWRLHTTYPKKRDALKKYLNLFFESTMEFSQSLTLIFSPNSFMSLRLTNAQIYWIALRRYWNEILDKFRWETLQELLYNSNLTWNGCYLRNCRKKISFVTETIFIICIILCEIQFTFFL